MLKLQKTLTAFVGSETFFSSPIVTERNRMYFLYFMSMLMGALSIVLGVTLSVAAIAAGQWYLAPVALAMFSALAWMLWDLWRL